MAKTKQEVNLKRKLKRHLDKIAGHDRSVRIALDELGYPEPRVRPAGFEAFLSIIVSQQISTEAAAAIWLRLTAVLPSLTPEALIDCKTTVLRGVGLSGRKIEYAIGLAQSIREGNFCPQDLKLCDNETVIEHITKLRGFGRWSAEIYLLFSLQRMDVFPADDLALQLALQRLMGLKEKPSAKHARVLVDGWKPCRSAGSLFLWHYYRGAPA